MNNLIIPFVIIYFIFIVLIYIFVLSNIVIIKCISYLKYNFKKIISILKL